MIEHDGPGAVTLGAGDRALAVAAVKALLRVGTIDEDALIAAFAETALGLAEQFLGRVTVARAMRETLPASAAWQSLGAVPVRLIAGVERSDGTPFAADRFAVDIDTDGVGWMRLTGAGGWVRTAAVGGDRVVAVRFTAGMADDWAGLPMPLRQGVALLAAYLFDARDTAAPPPAAVTALWRPFRRIALGETAHAG